MPSSTEVTKCIVCGGGLAPLCVCSNCKTAQSPKEYTKGRTSLCPNCSESVQVQFVCENCGTRYLYEEVIKDVDESHRPQESEVQRTAEPQNKPPRIRKPRRLKGEFDEEDAREIARIPGVGLKRAEMLCKAGYNSLHKIKQATEDKLSVIPGIGSIVAREIKSNTSLILTLPKRRSKEEIFREERECSKCGLPTSLFSRSCLECGSTFQAEDLDEQLSKELESQGINALIEFYGQLLCNAAEDAQLWFALALALKSAGCVDACKKASTRARKLQPDNSKYQGLEDELKDRIEPSPAEDIGIPLFGPKSGDEDIPTLEKPPESDKIEPEAQVIAQASPPSPTIGIEDTAEKPAESETKGQPTQDELTVLMELGGLIEDVDARSKDESSVDEESDIEDVKKAAEPLIVSEPLEAAKSRKELTSTVMGRRPLVTGHGLVNGRGRVNGLINGNGFVNGGMISDVTLPRGSMLHRYVAVVALLLTIFLIVNSALQIPIQPTKSIQIDGNIGDWQPVGTYTDATPSANPNTNLVSYSLKFEGQSLFFMAEVEGTFFGDSQGYDAFYIFLDVDGDNSTGYWGGALGAEYLVTVDGFNSTIFAASLKAFSGQDRLNWNQWAGLESVSAIVNGGTIEGEAHTMMMPIQDPSLVLARFVVDDQEGEVSQSAVVVGLSYGALKVIQRGLTTVLPTGLTQFLELTFEVTGSQLTLDAQDIHLWHSPGTQLSALPNSLIVTEGIQRILTIALDASVIATGAVVEARLTSVIADRPITIVGDPARAYVLSPPAGSRVDGLFADWPAPHADSDAVSPNDRGLDIEAYDANATGSTAHFYFRTFTDSLEGSIAPVYNTRAYSPPSGGGGVAPSPRVTGESVARAFVESSPMVQDGCAVGGILADYMVELKGQYGAILSISIYQWQSRWVIMAGGLEAAIMSNEVEFSATISGIDLTNSSYVIQLRDWRGQGDETVFSGTRGGADWRTRGLYVEITGSATLLTALPTSSPPTIDGDWSSSEWADADYYDTGNIVVFTMQDGSNLYLAIRVMSDTVYNAGDYAEIAFDTDNGDEATPQSEDRMFVAADPDGSVVPEDYAGDGSVWDSSYSSPYSWDVEGAQDTSDDNYITYEFSIPFEEVWGTPTPSPGQIAGLAVHAHDDEGIGADYYWGSTDMNDLSSFGALEIPEFQDAFLIVLLTFTVMVILRQRPGKNNKHRRH